MSYYDALMAMQKRLNDLQAQFNDLARVDRPSLNDSNLVHKTGDETIAGVKTFTSSPILPNTGGWKEVSGWSYASAATITVPSGAGLIYSVGDQIRWKQGGDFKYGVIKTVANTLLTIIKNDNYTVANSAITYPAISKGGGIGFPEKFFYFMPYTGLGTLYETVIYYSTSGRLFRGWGKIRGVSNSDTFSVTLPVPLQIEQYVGWERYPGTNYYPCLGVPAGDVVNLYRDSGFTVWPATGRKEVYLSLIIAF